MLIETIQRFVDPGSAVKLAAQLEGLVRQGRLPPEALLPPVRELAGVLGVSPGTAAAAYRQLQRQGLVHSDGRRGTRVLPQQSAREYGEAEVPPGVMDLMVANPDPALLPDLGPAFARLDARSDSYGGSHAQPALLERMGEGFRADGVDQRNMVVLGGAVATIHRALGVCAAPGDRVVVEDPGFHDHHDCVRARNMVPVPAAMDEEGVRPEALEHALRAGATAVVLTPRLQSPTGTAWGRARAAELKKVLAGFPEVAVLLDDYAALLADADYHHILPVAHRRWLVVRHLNKALAPDLRVAVAAADAETADRLRRELWLADGWVSGYLQRVAALALERREVRAAVARARRVYAARRNALLEALAARGVKAQGRSGLNVWVPVADEASAVTGLLRRGYCVRPGARYRLLSAPGLRLTTARLPEERAPRVADAVAEVLRPGPGGRRP